MAGIPYEVFIRAFAIACYGVSDVSNHFFTQEGGMFYCVSQYIIISARLAASMSQTIVHYAAMSLSGCSDLTDVD